MAKESTFTERFAAVSPTKVDRERGIIEGVKAVGRESKNGRLYTGEAINGGVGLYEGAVVNVDHAKAGGPVTRSYGDRIGYLKNARVKEGEIYADLHFNPKHALAEQLAWDAENAPKNVGLSHNVTARTSRSNGKTIVESILKVHSVDLVADPATTNGLYESVDDHEENMSVTIEAVRENKSVHDALKNEWLAEQQNSDAAKALRAKVDELTVANKALTEQIDAAKAKESADKIRGDRDKLITEAKLPEFAVTDIFREQVYGARDETAAKAIVEERQKLVGNRSGGTRSIEQGAEGGGNGGTITRESFVGRLKSAA